MTSSPLPPIPPSPTQSYASTAFPTASLNLPSPPPPQIPNHYLSGGDVKASIAAYEALSETAKAYRKELSSVAAAASSFGAALEACARCMSTLQIYSNYKADPRRQGRRRHGRRAYGRLGPAVPGG